MEPSYNKYNKYRDSSQNLDDIVFVDFPPADLNVYKWEENWKSRANVTSNWEDNLVPTKNVDRLVIIVASTKFTWWRKVSNIYEEATIIIVVQGRI